MIRKLLLLLSILIFLGSLALILSGSWLLVQPLFFAKSVPLGTITTWAGIIALPCMIFYAIRGFHPPSGEFMKVFRMINIIIIFLSFCWGIASYFLAGNWGFNFSGDAEGFSGGVRAYHVFQQFTIFLLVLPIVYALIFIFSKLVLNRKKN